MSALQSSGTAGAKGASPHSPVLAPVMAPVMTEPPRPAEVALRGLCPRCGARTLFAGITRFAPACRSCGLDFEAYNVGDGPAAFLILVIGALVTFLAILLELAFGPPAWLHFLLWPAVTLAAVLGGLRFAKGLLLAIEHQRSAREGRRG